MNSTKNYALIDNCSGYVCGIYAAESPEKACAAATLNDGGEIANYEFAYRLASNESGYLVYDAPAGFIAHDGQNPDEIAAVSAMNPAGKFRRMQSDSDQ